MSGKKRGLGRGLDALLGGSKQVAEPEGLPASREDVTTDGVLRQIPVDQIARGQYQPRRHFDEEALSELADSIRQHGLLQPVVVMQQSQNRFELIAGERRWRASQAAGLDTIPALIKSVSPDRQLAMALIENIQRENLNPMEEAYALTRLIEEFSLTHQAVADSVGKSRTAVTNATRLARLAPDAAALVAEGALDMGHGRALLSLPLEQQGAAGRLFVAKAMSVRQAEAWVKKTLSGPAQPVEGSVVDPDVARLEQDLSAHLGQSVSIKQSGKTKGALSIKYNTLEELEGVLVRMGFETNR
jgi:ParB family chromosome partitioning protein